VIEGQTLPSSVLPLGVKQLSLKSVTVVCISSLTAACFNAFLPRDIPRANSRFRNSTHGTRLKPRNNPIVPPISDIHSDIGYDSASTFFTKQINWLLV